MFFANISIAEKYNYLEEKFVRAYRWLAETDIKSLPEGSYPIWDDKVIANVQEYMVSGEEQFGVCKLEGLKLCESHEDNDLYFYEEPAESGTILLKEGDLIVVEPEEAHKPRLVAGGEKKAVKKVVVKVAL